VLVTTRLMRSHESKRGGMAVRAACEGDSPDKVLIRSGPMISNCQQATVQYASWRVCRTHPGFEAQSSLNRECAVTMEIPS
jgi:hypothetical protein